jgi:hypothetical protein
MRGKAVPLGVASDALGPTKRPGRRGHGALHGSFVR